MKLKSIFSIFIEWLKSPAVFGSKKMLIPGQWHLFEFYVDKGEELLHFDEDTLKKNQMQFVLSFFENHEFKLAGKAPVKLLEGTTDGNWSVARNFITLINPKEFRNNIEFQFAFEKGNLKLLKKDAMGKIEFFGFFYAPKQKS